MTKTLTRTYTHTPNVENIKKEKKLMADMKIAHGLEAFVCSIKSKENRPEATHTWQ